MCSNIYYWRANNLGRRGIEENLREKLKDADGKLEEFYSVKTITVEETETIIVAPAVGERKAKTKTVVKNVEKLLVYVNDIEGLLYSDHIKYTN